LDRLIGLERQTILSKHGMPTYEAVRPPVATVFDRQPATLSMRIAYMPSMCNGCAGRDMQ
jgi:hypothetical protein